jgi:ubiquinone/menaquinone biosynthesis C-methylase UbiE
VGAGTGLNFAWYQPTHVERVEATEPDNAMLAYAKRRAEVASVPIVLTQAAVEALPFGDETFDSAVVTLMLCSVHDPREALGEIKRVLKAQGTLLLFEDELHAVEHSLQQHGTEKRKALCSKTAREGSSAHFDCPRRSSILRRSASLYQKG